MLLEFRRVLFRSLAELDAARPIWSEDPSLLTCYGTVYHPNRTYQDGQAPVDIPVYANPGRYKYVDRTFWQILMMNSEFEEAEEAGKLMTEEEKQKQFAEIFPDGKMVKYNSDLKEAKRLLQAVFKEAIKDPLDRKSTRLNSSHIQKSRMPSSA